MWLLQTLAMFALTVVLHSMLARMKSRHSLVFRFLCIGGAVGLLHAGLSVAVSDFTDEAISAILLYAAMCELYVFLFTMAASSISVSLMDRLAGNSGSPHRLEADYSEVSMVARRVDQLQTGGFLVENDGRLDLTPKGRRLVQAFVLLRVFFRHARPAGDFEARHD